MKQEENELLWSFDSHGRFGYRKIDAGTVASANFLDERTLPTVASELEFRSIDFDVVQRRVPISHRYIFHTAFCGSTLLCRLLTDQPRVMVLKEPDVLLQIARHQLDRGSIATRPYLRYAINELSKPWQENGIAVIKPTNSANRLLPDIQEVAPGKALLLYSNLEDFILSSCKKLPQAESIIPWMAQYLVHDSDLGNALGIDKSQKFNFLEACIITWYSQMEYYHHAMNAQHGNQVKLLSMENLLDDPFACAIAASEFLELNFSKKELVEKTSISILKNSKSVESEYSADQRKAEKAELKKRFSSLLSIAIEWESDVVRPVAVLPDFNQCRLLV